MSVCLFCLAARIPQKRYAQTSLNVLHMIHVDVAWSISNDNAMRYVRLILCMTSVFAHNGLYGALLVRRIGPTQSDSPVTHRLRLPC